MSINNSAIVHLVKSFDETIGIVNGFKREGLYVYLQRVLTRLILFFANRCITILKFCFFKTGDLSDRSFNNIVVYTLGIVGDNVVLLPALAAIRHKYKNAFITVISNCQHWDGVLANEVLAPSRFKDKLIIIKDYPIERRGLKLVYNKHLFPDLKCDLFINLSPFGNRGWMGAVFKELLFAYKLGAAYAVGFHISSYNRKNYFKKVRHYFVHNEPRRSRSVLQELNIKPIEDEDLFERSIEARKTIIDKLQSQGWQDEALYIINPGAKFVAQRWPADNFAQIVKDITYSYGGLSVLTGISSEKSIASDVAQKSGVKVINLAGLTSVQDLVELMRMAKGCITNDTGTMHIAAMIGVPTVAIFSIRQSPTHWYPLGKHIIVLFSKTDCMLCYNDHCEKVDCLNAIETQHVKAALDYYFGAREIKHD